MRRRSAVSKLGLTLAALVVCALVLASAANRSRDPVATSAGVRNAGSPSWVAVVLSPDARLICIGAVLGSLGTMLLLRRIMRNLDQSASIPERVKLRLSKLEASREEMRRQNEKLAALATIDPLTACVNRRSLHNSLEVQWASAKRYGHALSCVMVDIDRFKSINDVHGHGTGDKVLQEIGGILREMARTTDIVCRYGGEEFLVLLPHVEIAAARAAAERFRIAIRSRQICGVSVTASFGVSSVELGASNPQELIDQADRALYIAKHDGRDRVVCLDLRTLSATVDGLTREPVSAPRPANPIPARAVSSLMEVLCARDAATAQHCMRVADLCVLVGGELMSPEQLYLLEVAALLHDIGKLGVPDAILLKPAPLNQEEQWVMSAHDRLGVSIILSALGSAELAKIVESHHAWYAGRADQAGLPSGEAIPLEARIIAIADTFDAMVSDRPYRAGLSRDKAFAELRRGAGRQFDPALVERFIAVGQRNITPSDEAKGVAA